MAQSGDIAIRPLGVSHAEAYRDLRLSALAETPQAFGASHDEEAAKPLSWFAEGLTASPSRQRFGTFAGGDLVGTAGFVIWSETAKSRHKGLLVGMHVAPGWRGRGLGEALLRAVIDHARGRVVILQAHVGATNRPAYRLYERLGFKPFGIEPKALLVDGVFIDEALMALDFSLATRES